MSDGVRVLAGLVGEPLPGRPASPADVLPAWISAVTLRGDGMDGLRVQLASHMTDALVTVLTSVGMRMPAVGVECHDRRPTDDHGGDPE